MPLSEFEAKKIEKTVQRWLEQRRPPPHIRPKLDLAFRVHGQSVEIFEIRPRWDHPDEKMEHSVAKATYTKARGIWKVYWMRADLKWHAYAPAPHVSSLEAFLKLVAEDSHACFFG